MALITCPDCQCDVSDLAPACPKCGRPIAPAPLRPAASPSQPTLAPKPNLLPTLVNLCAAGLLLFFFLPWLQLLGFNASGYDMQKLGSYAELVWLVPVCAGLTLLAGLYGQRQTVLAQVTGALPFLGLVYALTKLGDQVFHALAIGAYLTLITAGVLLVWVCFDDG